MGGLFVPNIGAGTRSDFQVIRADGRRVLKADPMARWAEPPPKTASVVERDDHVWGDEESGWPGGRRNRCSTAPSPSTRCTSPPGAAPRTAPSSASTTWRRSWPRTATSLGFTHIELLPIMTHPFGGSWGYQPLGLFAPPASFGTPADLARFVDRCHAAGLGVILDWVPGHFPTDAHGLARFDGTALYEHADPREGFHRRLEHPDLQFRARAKSNFLLASATTGSTTSTWMGWRRAVATMLYRDYSRREGEWIPNQYGGSENMEATTFLRS